MFLLIMVISWVCLGSGIWVLMMFCVVVLFIGMYMRWEEVCIMECLCIGMVSGR